MKTATLLGTAVLAAASFVVLRPPQASTANARPPLAAAADPESLPPVPQADPKSELTPLDKDKRLYLEKKPDGTRRVLLAAAVCLREGPLEVFLCKARTKEHESILHSDLDAKFIHAALLAAGAKPGKPVQFVDPKTGEEAYKPASGATMKVSVHYTKDGKTHTHPAQDWIEDLKTKKPMAHEWVFAGSRFVKNPDRPQDPEYYCANNGEVIGLSNFPDSMLDLPVQIGKDDATLVFQALTAKIPEKGSKVWVILEAEAAKK